MKDYFYVLSIYDTTNENMILKIDFFFLRDLMLIDI